MGELKRQTVGGIKWLVGSSFLQKGIQLASTVVLARILGPADFGLFALAFVAIDALSLFKSMGFDSALIQRKDNIKKAANTAFFIIPVLGIMLYLILTISAPLIGKFLNNIEVVGVIRALGIIFVISCLGRVPAALLEKNMQFRKVAGIEIGTALIYAVSAVTFAILKFGVWSLVYAYILKNIYQNTLTFIYAKWKPRFEFDKKIAKEMFHFGKFIFLGAVVWFLKMNLDNLLVGKLLGVATLGLYAIAFNIANFSSDYFGAKVFKVTYPAYSKLQANLEDLRSAYLETLKHTSLIAIPFGILAFSLSGELLRFVYGEKWIGATSALKILAFAGIFNTLPSSMGNIFLACGKPKLGLWVVSLQVMIFFLLIIPMVRLYGMNGAAIVVVFSSFVAFSTMFILSSKMIGMSFNQFLSNIKSASFSSLIMASVIFLLKQSFIQFKNYNFLKYNFLILLVFGLSAFLFSFYLSDKASFRRIKELISL